MEANSDAPIVEGDRVMEPTQELIDAIYREKVLRARRQPGEIKIVSGAELFEEACERMRCGIRADHPGIDDDGIDQIMRRRFARLSQVREVSR
jgi:hypothetical protein